MKRVNVNLFPNMLFMQYAIIFKMAYVELMFFLHYYKTYALAMQLFYVKLTLYKKELFQKGVMYLHLFTYLLNYLQNCRM